MKIADLQVLLKVAELQSITAAANQLDMSSSAASVSLKRIEQALGGTNICTHNKANSPHARRGTVFTSVSAGS